MSLTLKKIGKKYDGIEIYKDFDLTLNEGIITCIMGPSGCGKTTLLNMIGGLIKPDSGQMEGFDGKRFSYVFQETRLLPWKTVEGNLDFVLDHSLPKEERKALTDNLLKMVKMEAFANYYPSQLSGGMAQRVSIARAFAVPSDIILMDEPFSGIDINLKQTMLQHFLEIWKNDPRTILYVTHDVDEALLLSNEIVVFSKAPVRIVLQTQVDESNRKEVKDLVLDALE